METCYGIFSLRIKNFGDYNVKSRKKSFASLMRKEKKKNLINGLKIFGSLNVLFLFLLICVLQAEPRQKDNIRRTRKMAESYEDLSDMSDGSCYTIGSEESEDENEQNECSFIDSSYDFPIHMDDMEIVYADMWRRKEWMMRRGNYKSMYPYEAQPYGCKDSDLLREYSEEEINERIKILDDTVSVNEMFIIWSNVHRQERKKYIHMQEKAKEFCDHIASNCQIPESVKTRVWMHVYRCMTSVFLRFEKRHHKHFHMFLDRGPSDPVKFVNYINRTRAVWSKRRVEINHFWRRKMRNYFIEYWRRGVRDLVKARKCNEYNEGSGGAVRHRRYV
ncbi:Phist protein [Plasmodium gonderi]|uniref:Phist protein n=1 Tax=Plasmodium gonderi TaxID=77519 RepID=A0A1Y1JBJ7_PLAGO|nr:Phist protein [Plasmodium gonderi]GAW79866.1 Phist protein [Plasmodium gonderi]